MLKQPETTGRGIPDFSHSARPLRNRRIGRRAPARAGGAVTAVRALGGRPDTRRLAGPCPDLHSPPPAFFADGGRSETDSCGNPFGRIDFWRVLRQSSVCLLQTVLI